MALNSKQNQSSANSDFIRSPASHRSFQAKSWASFTLIDHTKNKLFHNLSRGMLLIVTLIPPFLRKSGTGAHNKKQNLTPKLKSNQSFTLIELLIVTLKQKYKSIPVRVQSLKPSMVFQPRSNKSFTLIELLIVIGILAILTAAVVVVLNPAELLKQSRDSKRMQDLTSIDKTIQILQTLNPDASLGTASTVYVSIADTSSTCSNLGLPTLPSGWAYNCVTDTNLHKTDGNGWIPINFQDSIVSTSIQLSSLPIDPTNTTSTGLYYTYTPGGSYEMTAAMESDKYKLAGDGDVASKDGGQYTGLYEKGTNLQLTPIDYGDTSLVGYWTFDEGSGTTAYDRSGHGYDGTLTNGPTYVTGKFGNYSIQSDGTDDKVVMSGMNMGTNDMTVSVWINVNGLSGISETLFFTNNSSGRSFQLYRNAGWSDNLLGFLVYYLKSDLTTAGKIWYFNITENNWYHVAFTLDQNSESGYLYLNGELKVSFTASDFNSWNISALTEEGIPYIFGGKIDDFRIYNRALSASEISAIYNSTK